MNGRHILCFLIFQITQLRVMPPALSLKFSITGLATYFNQIDRTCTTKPVITQPCVIVFMYVN